MGRELSSKFTPMYRWVIPGILTVVAIYVIWQFGVSGLEGRPELGSALFAVGVSVVLMVIARFYDRAKRVWLESDYITVSDYRREARMDLKDIEAVESTRLAKPERVRLRFAHPTVFGDSIVFFPPVRWFSSPHPIVAELNELVDAAKSQ